MKSKLIVLLSALLLTACEPSSREVTYSAMPEDLKDCKAYSISESGSYVKVMRCPNSSTSLTYHEGKSIRHTSVIEDNQTDSF